jgi:Protein of unknown function (DUF1292)
MTKSNMPIEARKKTGSTEPTITLVGDDGSCCSCQIIGVFEFEHCIYALLQKLDRDDEDALVAMRVVHRDGRANLETIEDDTEFNLVAMEIEKRTKISVREEILGKHIF